jgi:pyruvate-ferredoxin/flavodoxin oxidoreductase
MSFSEYAYSETRYRSLKNLDEKRAAMLMEKAEEATAYRAKLYQQMAKLDFSEGNGEEDKKE